MINWREKFKAFAIHFAATLAVALIAAALFFFVWFPAPFHEMVGGSELFMLVVGCDLALGPLVSLVIYNSRKSRRELYLDYSLVALVQVSALVYGMFVSFDARPVYVVFVKDRLEVVTAGEIADEELQAAAVPPEYRKRPLFGPKLVSTQIKAEDFLDALDHGLAGRDVSVRPKFFVPYETDLELVRAKALPLEELKRKHPEAAPLIANSEHDTATRWLPVKHKKGFWTALIDERSGLPVDYLPLDPY